MPPANRVVPVLLASVAVAIGLWFFNRPPPRTSPPGVVTPAANASQVSRFPTGQGVATINPNSSALSPPASSDAPVEPTTPCGNACFCGANADPCASRRQCAAGDCADALARQSWRVRLGGLRLNGASEPDGEVRVCTRVHGRREESCASLRETRGAGCSGGARLPASTEQLLDPGLDITIYDPQGQLLASASGAAYKFLTSREMCTGLRFGPGKFTGKTRVELLWFYLDD